MNKDELNKAIKTVLKTKVFHEKPNQLKAIETLKSNGFSVEDTEDSSRGYYTVEYNGRAIVVSRITDTNFSAVFMMSDELDEFWGLKIVSTATDGQYLKLSSYFDKVDYYRMLTKQKYQRVGGYHHRQETKVQKYIRQHGYNFRYAKLMSTI